MEIKLSIFSADLYSSLELQRGFSRAEKNINTQLIRLWFYRKWNDQLLHSIAMKKKRDKKPPEDKHYAAKRRLAPKNPQ
jgi:hypothetical protein